MEDDTIDVEADSIVMGYIVTLLGSNTPTRPRIDSILRERRRRLAEVDHRRAHAGEFAPAR